MRQKNTIYHLEEHTPNKATPDEIRKAKELKTEKWKKEDKQGQSEYRTKKYKS